MMDKAFLNELGFKIDKAIDNKNKDELHFIINTYKEKIGILKDSHIKAHLYYFLSNCWSGLQEIEYKNSEKNIWKFEQKELFQQIYYLRKAINENEFNDLDINLKLSILTNLAISFSSYGRTINALKYFNKALTLYPTFFMALMNKAICLEKYADLSYDDGHKCFFLKEAYFDNIEALNQIEIYLKNNNYDYNYYNNIKYSIVSRIKRIENLLSKEYLYEKDDYNDYSLGKYKNEKVYRQWVLDNTLFLNPMNDLGNFSIAGHDSLVLPNLITDTTL